MDARPRWLLRPRPSPEARASLVVFPHAGAGASAFRPFARALPPDLEPVLVQLPGRESRFGEPAATRAQAYVPPLVEALRDLGPRPFAFFGHSMGALLAFEVARGLAARGLPGPCHLVASAHRAPHLPFPRDLVHHLPDARLLDELARLAGTRGEVLENPELMELVLPALRADFTLCETYAHEPGEPLACGVTAIGGESDPDVPRASLDAWRVHTRGPFAAHAFPGGHFFVHEREADVVALVASTTRAALAPYQTYISGRGA